jgi:hypothetical protein
MECAGGKIQIANYLCPGNYAVSGSLEAAKTLEEIAKPDFGARMTVRQHRQACSYTTLPEGCWSVSLQRRMVRCTLIMLTVGPRVDVCVRCAWPWPVPSTRTT